MKKNFFEAIIGTLVLICAAFFIITSFKGSSIVTSDGYQIIAKFNNSDGISIGSDVKISGVKIGNVLSQQLDHKSYKAKLVMTIDPSIKIPVDSSIKIVSEGLLGSKYLLINPGSEEEFLQNNDQIEYTQSSVNFEELLGKFIFNSQNYNE
jgi:phospholipid/cholesterol/gamma-HCH transport system substrate-binding protein|tara:strand:- start:4135 stop:4587 length:453 start_codon:yes stop_codon:yes gene_type:complete